MILLYLLGRLAFFAPVSYFNSNRMKEIEVKFKVRDFREIRKKLQSVGAVLIWKGIEESFFFDTRESSLRKKGTLLRLRRWAGHSNTLTVKTKALPSRWYKIKHEYQIPVENVEKTKLLLQALGFKEYFRYKKYREHWNVGNASIELDKVAHLLFVEIEAPPKEIDRIARTFGLNRRYAIREGYIGILKRLLYYKRISP